MGDFIPKRCHIFRVQASGLCALGCRGLAWGKAGEDGLEGHLALAGFRIGCG
jgi:hypothetical protein